MGRAILYACFIKNDKEGHAPCQISIRMVRGVGAASTSDSQVEAAGHRVWRCLNFRIRRRFAAVAQSYARPVGRKTPAPKLGQVMNQVKSAFEEMLGSDTS